MLTATLLSGSILGYVATHDVFQAASRLQGDRKYLLPNNAPTVLLYGTLDEIDSSGEVITLTRKNPYDPREDSSLHIKISPDTAIRDIQSGSHAYDALPPIGTPVAIIVYPQNGVVAAQMVLRKI